MSDGAGIDELNREMKLSGCAEMLTGNGGLPKMRLKFCFFDGRDLSLRGADNFMEAQWS